MIFNSATQNLLVQHGKIEDDKSRKFIRDSVGVTEFKVVSRRHSILSGPAGVGKTHGTLDECNKANIKNIVIAPGTSDVVLAVSLASGVHSLKDDEELVVILDDADDLVFRDIDTINKWKLATAEENEETGFVPHFNHNVNMYNMVLQFEKAGNIRMVEAINAFTPDNGIGLSIPMNRVRFVILCNLDLEDSKCFGRKTNVKNAFAPVFDRFKYKRIDMNWDIQWGWLAHVLSNSQPFENKGFLLTDDQKKELLNWMYSNWDRLRSTSYRQVRDFAADMINDPDNYLDKWTDTLKRK
jgi:hypothetical protein